MDKTWRVTGPVVPVADLETLRLHLLAKRGLTAEVSARWFSPVYDRDVFDPLTLQDMDKAVDRIWRAIKKKERILVYGDYDADGITSTAILVITLQELGAHVVPFLPHREEQGYGLNQAVLERLHADIDLVVTCDCGVANAQEIAWLSEHGVDTVVIDHHTIPAELPEAVAVVHPAHPAHAYEGGPLCGAGVSWKVASALLRDPRSPYADDPDHEKWLLDLAVIGTVADMVSLRGENRTIAQFGLEILRRTRRPGLAAILSMLKLERASVSAEDIAFRLAPRLNAAGRMDHAQPALDLLLTHDSQHAEELVRQLEYLNRQRQTVTLKMLQEVEASVSAEGIIFAYNPRWRAGVVGLAAGRLADKYGRPAVVVGTNGRHAVGSARSPSSVNVLELLETGREYLLALGGHAQAAGFSLTEEKMADFQERLGNGGRALPAAAPRGESIDVVLDPILLTTTTLALVDTFAPFGEGNPRPTLLIQNLRLSNWRPVGKSGDHIKFTWEVNGQELGGIGFGLAEQMKGFDQGMLVDVVGRLETNEWRGQRSLQLAVQDVAPAGAVKVTSNE